MRPTFSLFIAEFTFRLGCVCLVFLGGWDVMLWRNLPVVESTQVCCHLLFIADLIRLFISLEFSANLLSTVGWFSACFAALSAASFPCIPTWAGTHTNVTLLPMFRICWLCLRIWVNIVGLCAMFCCCNA